MEKVIDVLKCKCPNCEEGKMFYKLGNILLFQAPKMYTLCKECNFKFEKEPGFFFGAMFICYALVVAEIVASVILFKYFFGFSYINVLFVAITTVFLLSLINFRVSRSIWIYMFYSR